jgi:hypothetical protein
MYMYIEGKAHHMIIFHDTSCYMCMYIVIVIHVMIYMYKTDITHMCVYIMVYVRMYYYMCIYPCMY